MFDFANNGKFVIVDSLLLCYDQVSLPFDHLKCCQTTFQLYIIPKESIKIKKYYGNPMREIETINTCDQI